ncbi:hypothetical protein [Amorphus orientalis]|uniref:Uncharacterized protein n=1 Tax=Amorphus orientalis TaxID=649198 RepID=A0AAE3VQH2_9HYPH|nr:hypothetical protein [Amorphus orientalis]MDQ0315891.1 hypothetical protein [Amorphus orientalis]
MDWLSLAATPTFAVMAWISAAETVPGAICTAGAGPLPLGGMVTMYLLMSVFHLPPWLKLASRHLRRPV